MSRKTRRSTKKSRGGTHHKSRSHQMTRKQGMSARRLKGAITHRKRPFASSRVPMSEVVGTMSYTFPRYGNAMMRQESARNVYDRKKRASERRIKEDIQFEEEFERMMEEAKKKNEENAAVNAELERMLQKHQRKEHKKSMKAMMRQFEGL